MNDGRRANKWSQRDANAVGLWVLLLLSGVLFKPMIAVAFAVAIVAGVWAGVRELRRRRRWRDEPPPEFWIERIKD